jgi:hypothetical protein
LHRSAQSTPIAVLIAAALVATACNDAATRGPAAIYVAVETRTDEPMTFGYGVSVDGTPFKRVPFGRARFTIGGFAPGVHVVSTTDLPGICSGGEPREVPLNGGDTVTVVFNLTCSRVSADLSIAVTTIGSGRDFDGYDVFLDGNRAAHIIDGNRLIRFQPVGSHVVSLAGVADYCMASAPVPVQLTVGASASASFVVTCPMSGPVKVLSAFTGTDIDADGAVATLDGVTPLRAPSASGIVRRIPVGSHSFAFTDIAPNCTTTTPLSGVVAVTANDTTFLRVAGVCSPIGLGAAGLTVTDPVGDTFGGSAGSDSSVFDLTSVTMRRSPGWMILVLHFANSQSGAASSGLYGNIDLDTDENPATGSAPLVNLFGGHARQGADYSVILTGDANVAGIVRAGAPRDSLARVRLLTGGDSVVVLVALNKLGGDDGNATATILVGTRRQPSDVAPNANVIVVRRANP